jgi:hypothetical protein
VEAPTPSHSLRRSRIGQYGKLSHDGHDRPPSLDERVHRPVQHRHLVVAPDERGARLHRLVVAGSDDLVGGDALADALELLGAELLHVEAALDLAHGRRPDHHAAVASDLLQPRRDVHCLAERIPGVVTGLAVAL